jgi:hypothetical protein
VTSEKRDDTRDFGDGICRGVRTLRVPRRVSSAYGIYSTGMVMHSGTCSVPGMAQWRHTVLSMVWRDLSILKDSSSVEIVRLN